jgi:hypothetical protein
MVIIFFVNGSLYLMSSKRHVLSLDINCMILHGTFLFIYMCILVLKLQSNSAIAKTSGHVQSACYIRVNVANAYSKVIFLDQKNVRYLYSFEPNLTVYSFILKIDL